MGTAIPNPQKYVHLGPTYHYHAFLVLFTSIPHASPPSAQQGLSISPTNSTSPVKESSLGSQEVLEPQEQEGPDTQENEVEVDSTTITSTSTNITIDNTNTMPTDE